MIERYRFEDTEGVRLVSEPWDVFALPAAGGRVVSLVDDAGIEWLAQSGRRWKSPPPALWVDGDTRGWDECFPNIAPGRHPETGVPLPDHGDLWASSAKWDEGADVSLRTQWTAPTVGARLSREIAPVSDGSLRIDYSAVVDRATVAAWSMHLLLSVRPEDVILAGDVQVRVDSAEGVDGLEPGEWLDWASVRGKLPLGEAGWACKLATRPGSAMRAAARKGQRELEITFGRVPRTPCFGLWLNAGGLPGAPELHHVGIEPAFGDCDDLTACVQDESALTLPPGPSYWTVVLRSRILRHQ